VAPVKIGLSKFDNPLNKTLWRARDFPGVELVSKRLGETLFKSFILFSSISTPDANFIQAFLLLKY